MKREYGASIVGAALIAASIMCFAGAYDLDSKPLFGFGMILVFLGLIILCSLLVGLINLVTRVTSENEKLRAELEHSYVQRTWLGSLNGFYVYATWKENASAHTIRDDSVRVYIGTGNAVDAKLQRAHSTETSITPANVVRIQTPQGTLTYCPPSEEPLFTVSRRGEWQDRDGNVQDLTTLSRGLWQIEEDTDDGAVTLTHVSQLS